MKKTISLIVLSAILLISIYEFRDYFSNQPTSLDEVKMQIRQTFPTVKQLTTNEYRKLTLDDNSNRILLLDVREREEYKISHLKNAVLSTDIEDALLILRGKPKSAKIIAYCSVGYRSSKLVTELMNKGFSDVSNLEGSLFEWANKGYPVYLNGKQVEKVHPYDKEWGKFLDKRYHPVD